MVAVDGSPNDLQKSLWDNDQDATNWCRDIGPHSCVVGEGLRLDETTPKRNGGIKSSGLVLVKSCRTKKRMALLAEPKKPPPQL